jgi:PadR family transcriptional regulator PadR
MRAERELMRGAGPVAVLKLLARGEMYGYELAQALAERSSGVLAMGQSTLYPLLYNLQAKGLISARWDTDSGRKRKYYALTDRGQRRLVSDCAQWEALSRAMAALGVIAPPPAAASIGGGGGA